MSSAESMTTTYAALAWKAWDTNRARAAELKSLITEWDRTGACTTEQRQHAGAIAHSLRGSAGTFGHVEASRAAEELVTLLAPPRQDDEPGQLVVLMARIDEGLASEPVLEY